MLQQLCDAASDFVLIENNGATWKCVATPFWSDSIRVFHSLYKVGRNGIIVF